MCELISTLKEKAQARTEWSNTLPKSHQHRLFLVEVCVAPALSSRWETLKLYLYAEGHRHTPAHRRRNKIIYAGKPELSEVPSFNSALNQNIGLHVSPTARNCHNFLPSSFIQVFFFFSALFKHKVKKSKLDLLQMNSFFKCRDHMTLQVTGCLLS